MQSRWVPSASAECRIKAKRGNQLPDLFDSVAVIEIREERPDDILLRDGLCGKSNAMDKERAIRCVEQNFEGRENSNIARIKIDPLLDPLLGDPRFEALAQKVVGPSAASNQ